MKGWAKSDEHFVPDGALRDIYIVGGGEESWRAFLMFVEPLDATFEVDGERRSVPRTVDEAFEMSGEATALPRFDWNGILVCCHFFDRSQVELNIDPREPPPEGERLSKYPAQIDFLLWRRPATRAPSGA
jgi:hypothetical protein